MSLRRTFLVFCFTCCFLVEIYSQAYPDRHSTNLSDSWLSCQTSSNPNSARGNGHWIMFNLGDIYSLTSSKIWNFNTPERINTYDNQPWSISRLPGKLEDGMKDMIIDISLNGVTWQEWGRFTLPKGPGSSFYQGVSGPDFGGKLARFVLITAVSNHGGNCYGLGEIKFNGTIATTSPVDDAAPNVEIIAIPNPFSDQTTISFNGLAMGKVNFELYNIMGKQLKSLNYMIKTEKDELQLSADDLYSGIYFLKLIQKDFSKTIKLEVIK